MLNVSFRYTVNEHQAQDIVQLSFIKVFKKISQYSLENSLEGWIRRIVINTAVDEIRKNKQRDNVTDIDFSIINLEEKTYTEEPLNIILETVKKLSPAYREVFELYVLKEYQHKEIAEKLGINEGTSKSNLHKAKAKLRCLLKNKLEEEYFS